jgi:hypothetical protein
MSLSVLSASQTKSLLPKAVVLMPGQVMLRNGVPLRFQQYVAYANSAQDAKKTVAKKARRSRYVYFAEVGPVQDERGKFVCIVAGAH